MRVPAARVTIPREDRPALYARFDRILDSGRLTLGPFTETFEEAFAERVGARYAVAVNSGTSALEIVLRALDVGGRRVLVPTNTFFATAAAALHAGARVQFVDVAPHLMANVEELEHEAGAETAAIIVVHIGGYPHPEIQRIQDLCADRGIPLVEDAAHAHGTAMGGRSAGTFGVAGAFSFYPTKVMTSGEGGMIVTDDAALARRARTFRDQGKPGFRENYHVELGYNWRMSELHAALGLEQLERLDEFIAARRRASRRYDRGMERLPHLHPMVYSADAAPNFYKYIAFLDGPIDRPTLKERLRSTLDVSLSGEVYETPCHRQPIFAHLPMGGQTGLSNADRFCASHVCLPLYPSISPDEQEYVLRGLKEVLS